METPAITIVFNCDKNAAAGLSPSARPSVCSGFTLKAIAKAVWDSGGGKEKGKGKGGLTGAEKGVVNNSAGGLERFHLCVHRLLHLFCWCSYLTTVQEETHPISLRL